MRDSFFFGAFLTLFLVAIGAILLIVSPHAPRTTPVPTPSLTGNVILAGEVPAEYAPPWDVWTGELFFTLEQDAGQAHVKVHRPNAWIYNTFYVSNGDSWEARTFSTDQQWIPDEASATFTPRDGETYVLVYSCKRNDDAPGGWDCGCRNAQDTSCRHFAIQNSSFAQGCVTNDDCAAGLCIEGACVDTPADELADETSGEVADEMSDETDETIDEASDEEGGLHFSFMSFFGYYPYAHDIYLIDCHGSSNDEPQDLTTFTYGSQTYLLANLGNELAVYSLEDPDEPRRVYKTDWHPEQVKPSGDWPHMLNSVNVVDQGRFGVANTKNGLVIFKFAADEPRITNYHVWHEGFRFVMSILYRAPDGETYLLTPNLCLERDGFCVGGGPLTLYHIKDVDDLEDLGPLVVPDKNRPTIAGFSPGVQLGRDVYTILAEDLQKTDPALYRIDFTTPRHPVVTKIAIGEVGSTLAGDEQHLAVAHDGVIDVYDLTQNPPKLLHTLTVTQTDREACHGEELCNELYNALHDRDAIIPWLALDDGLLVANLNLRVFGVWSLDDGQLAPLPALKELNGQVDEWWTRDTYQVPAGNLVAGWCFSASRQGLPRGVALGNGHVYTGTQNFLHAFKISTHDEESVQRLDPVTPTRCPRPCG